MLNAVTLGVSLSQNPRKLYHLQPFHFNLLTDINYQKLQTQLPDTLTEIPYLLNLLFCLSYRNKIKVHFVSQLSHMRSCNLPSPSFGCV